MEWLIQERQKVAIHLRDLENSVLHLEGKFMVLVKKKKKFLLLKEEGRPSPTELQPSRISDFSWLGRGAVTLFLLLLKICICSTYIPSDLSSWGQEDTVYRLCLPYTCLCLGKAVVPKDLYKTCPLPKTSYLLEKPFIPNVYNTSRNDTFPCSFA